MPMLKLYKSRLMSSKVIFTTGKELLFVNGRYPTDDEDEIKFLDAEIRNRHPHIYIDEKEKQVDSDRLDPLEEIKRRAVEEYLEKQKEMSTSNRDMGTTDQSGKLEGILTSDNVAGIERGTDKIPGTIVKTVSANIPDNNENSTTINTPSNTGIANTNTISGAGLVSASNTGNKSVAGGRLTANIKK